MTVKCSAKLLSKIHKQVDERRMEKANEFLTDLATSKFSGLLRGLDAIESEQQLNKKLQKDKLLKREVQRVIALQTPYILAIGILSGGITIGKHIFNHVWQKANNEAGALEQPG